MNPPEDPDAWRRMPVPRMPPELGMTIRQFRDGNPGRREQLMREIARRARSQPAEIARLIQRWLHEDD